MEESVPKADFKVMLLILFITATTIFNNTNSFKIGACVKMSKEEFISNKYAQMGLKRIMDEFHVKPKCEDGYVPDVVDLPDLDVCKQQVAGWNYQYKWTKVRCKCVQHPEAGKPVTLKPYSYTRDVNCNASFWAFPHICRLTGPTCK